MTFALRALQPGDLPHLLEIEKASFSSPRWPAESFMAYECLIAEIDGRMAGFLVSREVFKDEREILNLAVSPQFRRLGVAKALLQEELKRAKEIFLEVRESNVAAQQLYRQFGFVEISRRPNYYDSPNETAIVMKMKWC